MVCSHGLGRPWGAVRAHYGALPSMAGRDRRRVGKPAWMASLLAPAPGSPVPGTRKSPRWSVGRRFRGLWFPAIRRSCCGTTNQGASFGAPPPLTSGWDQSKARAHRSRENAEAWLFEIRIEIFAGALELSLPQAQRSCARWGGWRVVSVASNVTGGVIATGAVPEVRPHPTGLRPATLPTARSCAALGEG